jgi:hypothetical protein
MSRSSRIGEIMADAASRLEAEVAQLCVQLVEADERAAKLIREKDELLRDRPVFELGRKVFLAIQPWDDRRPGMVTGINLRPSRASYDVTWADDRRESIHYEMELVSADEKDND